MHITNGNYSYKCAANAGLINNCIFKSDYLISQEQVNLFQYEVKSQAKEWSVDAEIEHKCEEDDAMGNLSWEGPNNPSDSADGEVVESFCTKNWRSAQEKQSALAIYDINGSLPIACRHGFIEAFCEIVHSGELWVHYFTNTINVLITSQCKVPSCSHWLSPPSIWSRSNACLRYWLLIWLDNQE